MGTDKDFNESPGSIGALNRREFIDGTGLVGLGIVLGLVSPAAAQQSQSMPVTMTMTTPATAPERVFFSDAEASFIEAAVGRIIPSDGEGPGAIEAGVPNYIDKQLGGSWGSGERLYMGGPYKPDAIPQFGYQLPYTPAEMFRRAIGAIDAKLKSSGQSFAALSAQEQDSFLREQLEHGGIGDLDGVPPKIFFAQLLSFTVEGYFSDPAYGGNKNMVAWKALGFPGAYDAYDNTISQHGKAFRIGPYSMLDHGTMPMQDLESMEQQK